MQLTPFKKYNCRLVGASEVRRGFYANDSSWYGIYYGEIPYLEVHDFSAWHRITFDISTLGTFNPSDYTRANENGDTVQIPIGIYLPFGSDWAKAAKIGGCQPPGYNRSGVSAFLTDYKAKIDNAIVTNKCNMMFFDECDVYFWDQNYLTNSSSPLVMLNILQELCDYVRSKGAISIINGSTYYAKTGEIFLMEDFVGNFTGPSTSPTYAVNKVFQSIGSSLYASGVNFGENWTTGIEAWLYFWKHAHSAKGDKTYTTIADCHAYRDPTDKTERPFHEAVFCGFSALGLSGLNLIDANNQILQPLYLHNFYRGFPLETPQFDIENEKITRKFSGCDITYSDKNVPIGSSVSYKLSRPDYWWKTNQDFEDIDWATDAARYTHTSQTCGTPSAEYVINDMWIHDDRTAIYLRFQMNGVYVPTEANPSIPLDIYLELDSTLPGYQVSRNVSEPPYWYLADMKAQVYLFGSSIFKFNQIDEINWDNNWTWMYDIEYKQSGVYHYFRIRKDTLKHIVSTWDEISLKIIPSYSQSGVSVYTDKTNTTSADACMGGTPDYCSSTVAYPPAWYPSCPLPNLGDSNEKDYNQILWNDGSGEVVSYNFTVYGYISYVCTVIKPLVPHSGVIFSGVSHPGKKISSVSVSGTFEKAWIFDRQTAKFVGPDNTPNTWFTTNSFSPAKDIDATDIYVGISNDSSSQTDDTFSVTQVDVELADLSSGHAPAYDVPLPHLIEFDTVFNSWEQNRTNFET